MISPVMSTEERLRAAARAAADTVAPGSAPPLRLPDDPAAGPLLRGGGSRRRRWLRALTPLAAAAAVAAAVIVSLTLTSRVPTSTGGAQSPARSQALSSVPPYYVALTSAATPAQAVIRSTVTGAVVARVKPPRPYGTFNFVSGAADDRTFILAAQRWWHIGSGTAGLPAEHRDNSTAIAFFRLRFDPATRTARLTALHLPQNISAASLSGVEVSPDGSRLALTLHEAQVEVITLATGSARHWAWPGSARSPGIWVGNDKPSGQPVSWTANGQTLAFKLTTKSGGITSVMVLDTSSPGGSLRSAAHRSVTFEGLGHVKSGPIGNALITPDGTRIVTVTQRAQASSARVTEFSARTGRPVNPPLPGTASLTPWDVLWTDASGSTLLVDGLRTGPHPASVTGILHGGRFTPLPGPPVQTNNVAW